MEYLTAHPYISAFLLFFAMFVVGSIINDTINAICNVVIILGGGKVPEEKSDEKKDLKSTEQ